MAELNLKLRRQHYSSRDVESLLDRDFQDFDAKDKQKDIKRLFRIYDDVYFDMPKEGEESHTTLILKSRDFVRDFIDPKDVEIFDLTEQISDLNARILELEIQLISGSALPDVSEIDDDLEAAEEFPDENNDGIDDRTQQFAEFGTPRRLILTPSNNDVARLLQNPRAEYYKDKYYGRQIYKFTKRGDAKNKIVVYDGARKKTGKRFLVDIENGKSYKIPKRHWKSKNRKKLFKP